MKPMLCSKATVEEARELFKSKDWVAERKFDGIRAFFHRGRLYDRRGKEITKQFPEFVLPPSLLKNLDTDDYIDGEIVAASGEFDDVSGRVHLRDAFKIKMSAKLQPAIFMAFDFHNSSRDMGLDARDGILGLYASVEFGSYPWFQLKQQWRDFDEAWGFVEDNGWEGLVIKRRYSYYQEGVRSPEWRKVKRFQETSAVFTKLETHPKGVRLETDDGRSVNVNGLKAEEVKAIFKRAGKVTCEVQYLPQNGSDVWRFPSFRGVSEVQREV